VIADKWVIRVGQILILKSYQKVGLGGFWLVRSPDPCQSGMIISNP
jgi:hypothetical protein